MNYPTMHWRRGRLLLAVIPLVLLALTAGCGGGTDHGTSHSTTDHNQADVTFATEMLQHHAQALAMVDLTVNRPMDPQFKALATRIRDAQAPEIETMAGWLSDWNERIPETSNDHEHADMGTMPEGTEDMPGMMSADEMKSLEAAPDTEFQKMWLEMMVRHHQGAIQMAKTEKSDGKYKPAVDLAESIISSQSKEITEMQGLISTL